MAMIPEKVLEDLKNSTKIVAFTHIHPDGDALGSLLAFSRLMESLGREVFCLIEEPVSHLYSFMPGVERLSCDREKYRDFVRKSGGKLTGVSLDCGDKYRMGELYEELLAVEPFVVIDHHASHQDFGTSRWVNIASSSTGEMVYEIAEALGAELDYESAYNLYVALVTDTGSFQYECTGHRTLEIASKLLEKGVEAEEVSGRLYDNYSIERLSLLQRVLGSVDFFEEEQIALMAVTQEMLRSSGATMLDAENFINFPRAVQTVKVAVLIKEEKDKLSISMRAKGDVDVSDIAKMFGGGGHRNAAGFRLRGESLGCLREKLLKEIASRLPRG